MKSIDQLTEAVRKAVASARGDPKVALARLEMMASVNPSIWEGVVITIIGKMVERVATERPDLADDPEALAEEALRRLPAEVGRLGATEQWGAGQ